MFAFPSVGAWEQGYVPSIYMYYGTGQNQDTGHGQGNQRATVDRDSAMDDSVEGPSLVPRLSVSGERESLVSTVCACA